MFANRLPSTFPSGQGSDLAGIVEEIGPGVAGVAVGDEVIGFTNERSSQAEFVLVESGNLVPRPANVPWEQAGALFVAGTTAYAAARSVGLSAGDTVVVSGAAGGVGSIAVQLARNAGARVIGLSGDANHKWLADHGVIPVAYGDVVEAQGPPHAAPNIGGIHPFSRNPAAITCASSLEDRIRVASGGKVDAFVDTFGGGYVELALKLGVAPDRIDTIIDFAAAAKYGVKTEGSHEAANAEVLAELAGLLAAGRLEIPIARVYPLAEVRDAYRELEQRHTRGKIVLEP
jgi:NADPH:quinone reductase-like Zn-dependent oxidoreductase